MKMDHQIQFTCLEYNLLSLDQLYNILKLRQEVFVVEQNCAYLDADGKDQFALHVLGFNEKNDLLAYARLFHKGIAYTNFQSIGRIITADSIRGKGMGKLLVEQSIRYCTINYGLGDIKISAQSHLIPFYNQFGFQVEGEGYLEDDIPHHAMIRSGSLS
jgi:ElaA protein